MFDYEIEQSDSRRQQVCGACGNIMNVPWEASVKLETQRPCLKKIETEKVPAPKRERKREMVYACAACSRRTRISVKAIEPRKTPITQKVTPIPATNQSIVPSLAKVSTLPGPPTAASSSKKRAKKKNGGLEALLANKKAADARSSGFGLDLMDFMKKT